MTLWKWDSNDMDKEFNSKFKMPLKRCPEIDVFFVVSFLEVIELINFSFATRESSSDRENNIEISNHATFHELWRVFHQKVDIRVKISIKLNYQFGLSDWRSRDDRRTDRRTRISWQFADWFLTKTSQLTVLPNGFFSLPQHCSLQIEEKLISAYESSREVGTET